MDIYNILKKLDAVEKKALTESTSAAKLNEGQMKRWLESQAEQMDKADFVANAGEYGMSDEEAAEFWNAVNGADDEELGESSEIWPARKGEKVSANGKPAVIVGQIPTQAGSAKYFAVRFDGKQYPGNTYDQVHANQISSAGVAEGLFGNKAGQEINYDSISKLSDEELQRNYKFASGSNSIDPEFAAVAKALRAEIKKRKAQDVAEGSREQPIKPGTSFRAPDHWNKADIVHDFLSKHKAVVDVSYSYETGKWTVEDSRPATEADMKQWSTFNGGLPSVKGQGVAEAAGAKGTKPDFLDMDKDGDKKEPMKKAAKDKNDARGAFQKQMGGSAKELTKGLSIKESEVDEGIGKTIAHGIGKVVKKVAPKWVEKKQKEFDDQQAADRKATIAGVTMLGQKRKKEDVNEVFPGTPEYELRFGKDDASSAFDKKKISTGTVYSRRYKDEPEADDDTPKKAGRPKGTGRKLGAKGPGVDSKLLKGKGGLKETDMNEVASPGQDLVKLARVVNSISTPEQYETAKKYAQLMFKKLDADNDSFSSMGKTLSLIRDIEKDLKAKAQELGISSGRNFIGHHIDETDMNEVAAPGQEDWIKKNKARFIDQYGPEKGQRILYATAWKRSKKNEAAPAQPNDKEDRWDAQALAQHKRKLAQDANRRKMAPKSVEETMGGTVAGGVAPAPGAKTFAEASSESHTTEWKAAGKAVHAILKKCGYKGTKTEKGYMWTKQTPKGTAFVDIDFDERDPEVVAWGEGELKGAKDKSYWQSGSCSIDEIADKIAELFANVNPGEASKEMGEADEDSKKSDDSDDALKKMKKHAGVDKAEDDKDESEDKDEDKEESDSKPEKGEKPDFGKKDDDSEEKDDDSEDDKSEDKEESDSDDKDDKDDDKEEKSESKDKSGTPYGQSVYESAFKKQLKQQLTESISMNTSEDDGGHKSVTVTATDEDADKLSDMLKMAGLFSSGGYEEVVVGADHVDEDLANAPDETYSSMDTILNKLSGGLNGPKTTGQTTGDIVNRDIKRQGPSVKTVAEEIKENTESKLWNLYKKYDNK